MQVCLHNNFNNTFWSKAKTLQGRIPANICRPVSFESVAHDNAWIYCFHNKATILSKAGMDTLYLLENWNPNAAWGKKDISKRDNGTESQKRRSQVQSLWFRRVFSHCSYFGMLI